MFLGARPQQRARGRRVFWTICRWSTCFYTTQIVLLTWLVRKAFTGLVCRAQPSSFPRPPCNGKAMSLKLGSELKFQGSLSRCSLQTCPGNCARGTLLFMFFCIWTNCRSKIISWGYMYSTRSSFVCLQSVPPVSSIYLDQSRAPIPCTFAFFSVHCIHTGRTNNAIDSTARGSAQGVLTSQWP